MSGIAYAGEYDLREMKILTSAGNVIDVKNIVQVIEIFEDMNLASVVTINNYIDKHDFVIEIVINQRTI